MAAFRAKNSYSIRAGLSANPRMQINVRAGLNLFPARRDNWMRAGMPGLRGAMHTESDEDLVKRIASGDRLAMKVLFSRHQVRVYRFVLRLVRDETLAEDVISDVFMDLWRQADRFEARASVSTWLLAIARNKAWSLLRKRRDDRRARRCIWRQPADARLHRPRSTRRGGPSG